MNSSARRTPHGTRVVKLAGVAALVMLALWLTFRARSTREVDEAELLRKAVALMQGKAMAAPEVGAFRAQTLPLQNFEGSTQSWTPP
jgi:hypothetical protein